MEIRERTATIRRLNDELRCKGVGGCIMITAGLRLLDPAVLSSVLRAIRAFDTFTAENDPHAEHDCSSLTEGGMSIVWKIDYYDCALSGVSPNPADPTVTSRVLTVMLAEEY
jgi:hypothetical protein